MTRDEVIKLLLSEDFLVSISGDYIFTQKFLQTNKPVITTPLIPGIYVPKVISYSGDNLKETWNAFIEATEVPFRVNAGDGRTYTVRMFSKPAANKLVKIITDPRIDYQKFIDSVKNYYKTVSYKVLLSRYLLEDLWEIEYNEWVRPKLNSGIEHTPGTSRFED